MQDSNLRRLSHQIYSLAPLTAWVTTRRHAIRRVASRRPRVPPVAATRPGRAGGESRTHNLRFTRPLLCQLSYASDLVRVRRKNQNLPRSDADCKPFSDPMPDRGSDGDRPGSDDWNDHTPRPARRQGPGAGFPGRMTGPATFDASAPAAEGLETGWPGGGTGAAAAVAGGLAAEVGDVIRAGLARRRAGEEGPRRVRQPGWRRAPDRELIALVQRQERPGRSDTVSPIGSSLAEAIRMGRSSRVPRRRSGPGRPAGSSPNPRARAASIGRSKSTSSRVGRR